MDPTAADGFQTLPSLRNNALTSDSPFNVVAAVQHLAYHSRNEKECLVVALRGVDPLAFYTEITAVPLPLQHQQVDATHRYVPHLKVWTTHHGLKIPHVDMPILRLHKTFTAAYPCLCMGVDILEDCLRGLCLDSVPSSVEDTRLLMQQIVACTKQLFPLKKAFLAVDMLRTSEQALAFIQRSGVFTLDDGTHMLRLPPNNDSLVTWPCQCSRQDAILLYNAMLQMHPNNAQLTQEFGYAHADEIQCTTRDDGKVTACRLCGLPFSQNNDVVVCAVVGCPTALHNGCTGCRAPLTTRWMCNRCTKEAAAKAVTLEAGCVVGFVFAGRTFTLQVESVCTNTKTFQSASHQYSTTQLLAQILKYDRMTPVDVMFPSILTGTPPKHVTTVLTARPGAVNVAA